jgi:hypothetical protein
MLLLAGIIACAGAASVALHCKHPSRHSCATVRHVSVADTISAAGQPLTEAQRAQLVAERARLIELIGEYEDAMERGEGCRMGFIKYRLDLLRIEEKLSRCDYERAHLQRQIAHLEALRARMLTGYGELQGPDGHDE